jgi:hypothetical protein
MVKEDARLLEGSGWLPSALRNSNQPLASSALGEPT